MKEGFVNTQKSNSISHSTNNPNTSNAGWMAVRVLDVILDENHPRFKELGGYSSIGTIIFQTQNSPINDPSNNFNYALPLLPNNKSIPLINEVVIVFNIILEGNNVGNKSKYYYLCSLNLWNTPHHNALPNVNKDLKENMNSDGDVKLNFTSKHYEGEFEERGDLNPLKQYPGDIIYEGRNGNSFRFGSTYKSKTNNWSSQGKNGDPILIIRNGVNVKNTSSWIPITEDVNIDASSIYATSTQQIPIKYTDNYSSLPNKPVIPSQYSNPQIIVISDRVIIKAKKDGVLISGEEFVHINSLKHIGLNSNYGITLNSNSVNLGSVDAEESLILGNTMLEVLKNFTDTIINVVDLLSSLQDFPGGSAIPSPLGASIGMLKPELESFKQLFSGTSLLSKVSKTV